jgi:hypothetical protein
MGHIGSRRDVGRRIAVAALAVGVSAATVACSSGSAKKAASLRTVSGPSSAAAPGGPAGGAADTAAPPTSGMGQPAAGAAPTSAAPAHAGGAAPSGGAATTVTTRPATTGAKPTTPVSTGPAPVAPGVYQYNLVGTGSSALTIGKKTTTTAAAAQSPLTVTTTAGMQQWTNSSTTTSLLFNSSGVFLLAETVPLFGTTCTFNSPVASPPWPLAAGKTFSGQATCGQGQATSTLTLKGSVSGSTGSTFVVHTTLTLSGTTLVISEWDTYAPSLGLPRQSTVQVTGGVTGFSINSLSTYALAP